MFDKISRLFYHFQSSLHLLPMILLNNFPTISICGLYSFVSECFKIVRMFDKICWIFSRWSCSHISSTFGRGCRPPDDRWLFAHIPLCCAHLHKICAHFVRYRYICTRFEQDISTLHQIKAHLNQICALLYHIFAHICMYVICKIFLALNYRWTSILICTSFLHFCTIFVHTYKRCVRFTKDSNHGQWPSIPAECDICHNLHPSTVSET